jgi:hypothetical protein
MESGMLLLCLYICREAAPDGLCKSYYSVKLPNEVVT